MNDDTEIHTTVIVIIKMNFITSCSLKINASSDVTQSVFEILNPGYIEILKTNRFIGS